jgi:predicted RNA binding protein YcfA (HicA-like mRNA interferase family)
MVRPSKLYQKLLQAPGQIITFGDFEKLLRAFGFHLERTVGSHRQYVHPDVPYPLPVQPERKEAKRYQVRQFLDIVEECGLKMDE